MTNSEIIMRTAIAKKVYTKEEVAKLIKTYGRLPLHTFQEWKKAGYSIKKGQHAKLSCVIWLPSTKDSAKDDKEKEDEKEVDTTHFFHKLAYFFGPDQVEKRVSA